MDYGDSVFTLVKTTDLIAQPAGATTNQLATSINAVGGKTWPVANRLTITVALSGSAKFGVTVNGGSAIWFNGGVALAATSVYTFTIAARVADAYNFQVDTGGVSVSLLYVEAVSGGI